MTNMLGVALKSSTVDSTPIGSTAPSTGAFTTLTATTPASNDDSTNAATTAWTLLGFAASLGSSGYIKFPSWLGGLALQWGITSQFDTGPTSIGFPLSFSSACYVVFATDYFGLGNTASRIWSIESWNTGSFSVHNNGLGAATWFAIGK